MTEREKLIDLLQNVPADYEGNRGVGTIANYLLENGVNVLPCSVGETWYVMASNCTRIAEVKIIAIFLFDDKSESRIIAEEENTNEKCIFSLDNFAGEASKDRERLENLLGELNRVRKNFNKLKEREENE